MLPVADFRRCSCSARRGLAQSPSLAAPPRGAVEGGAVGGQEVLELIQQHEHRRRGAGLGQMVLHPGAQSLPSPLPYDPISLSAWHLRSATANRPFRNGGTDTSNPLPSSAESANPRSRSRERGGARRRAGIPGVFRPRRERADDPADGRHQEAAAAGHWQSFFGKLRDSGQSLEIDLERRRLRLSPAKSMRWAL